MNPLEKLQEDMIKEISDIADREAWKAAGVEIGDCISHKNNSVNWPSKEELSKAWENYIVAQKAEWNKFMAEPSNCATHGRTIMLNLDGTITVSPEPPEYVDLGGCIGILNDIGKKRWSNGQSLNDWRCFELQIDKSVIEKGFV